MKKAQPNIHFFKTVEEYGSSLIIKYKVTGFRGDEHLYVYQHADWQKRKWQVPQVNRTQGDREVSGLVEMLSAEENYAKALTDAVKEARKLMKRVGRKRVIPPATA